MISLLPLSVLTIPFPVFSPIPQAEPPEAEPIGEFMNGSDYAFAAR